MTTPGERLQQRLEKVSLVASAIRDAATAARDRVHEVSRETPLIQEVPTDVPDDSRTA